MPSSGLDSEPSLCVEGGNQRGAPACVSVRLRKRVIYNGPTLCFPAPAWQKSAGCQFLAWFQLSLLVLLSCFNLRKKIFVLWVGPFGILMGVFAATSVHSCGLIDQISESRGVCLLSLYFPLQIHLVFSEPLCFLGCCRWCEGPPRPPTVPVTRQITRRS